MRVEFGEHLSALRSSRDELARSMNRLGETLSSTHDLPKLLAVVLEAAVQARRARAGGLLLLTPNRTALVREATFGLHQREPAERIPVGQDHGPAGNGGPEPTATSQVSVPCWPRAAPWGCSACTTARTASRSPSATPRA
jgi:GAF domain-containing protein